ncbi:MAG: hypothetical protein EOM37_11560 [Proteobacteria bacterium]|nr:hypothetical protein [Pseudomonadota bacterium]
MLNEICEHLHNFFDTRDGEFIDRTAGTFTISDGIISPLSTSIISGQYIRIVGSLLNDGIYLKSTYPGLSADFVSQDLKDEIFTGAIFGLAIPRDLVTLDTEITAYVAANPATGYISESFGGWSGSRATGANGAPISWKSAYAARLNRWRKV